MVKGPMVPTSLITGNLVAEVEVALAVALGETAGEVAAEDAGEDDVEVEGKSVEAAGVVVFPAQAVTSTIIRAIANNTRTSLFICPPILGLHP